MSVDHSKPRHPSPFATDDMLEGLEAPVFYTPVHTTIDFEAALQRGLVEVARGPDGGSTERFRKPGERKAPVRTERVPEVSLSLDEFVKAATTAPERPPTAPDASG